MSQKINTGHKKFGRQLLGTMQFSALILLSLSSSTFAEVGISFLKKWNFRTQMSHKKIWRVKATKSISLVGSPLQKKTIGDEGITVDFWIIKVHTSN